MARVQCLRDRDFEAFIPKATAMEVILPGHHPTIHEWKFSRHVCLMVTQPLGDR